MLYLVRHPKSRLLALLVSAAAVLALSGCPTASDEAAGSVEAAATDDVGTATESAEMIRIGTPPGAGAMALAGMIQQAEQREAAGVEPTEDDYDITVAGSPDHLTAELALGNLDAALLPLNVAATLYNRTDGDVQLVAITAQGLLYAVSEDDSIATFSDLDGKAIYTTGLGATPQYVIEHFKESFDVAFDRIDYTAEPPLAVAFMLSSPGSVGILPEPFVTSALAKNPDLAVVLDLGAHWADETGSPLVTTALVVRTEFAQDHREQVEQLVADVTDSVTWVREQPTDAAPVIEAAGIVPDAATAEAAIPRTNLVTMTGDEAREATLAFLRVLYEANPDSIGGSVPGDGFFWQ